MITTCEGSVSVNGTKLELIADLTTIFIGLIDEGYSNVVSAAIGVVMAEGGKALHDKND